MCSLATEYIELDLDECKSFMRDHFNVITGIVQNLSWGNPSDICAMQQHIPAVDDRSICINVVSEVLAMIPAEAINPTAAAVADLEEVRKS